MKENDGGSFRLRIVDSEGKLMHEENDCITIWTGRYSPIVGDELTLGYNIPRTKKYPDAKRITLRVLGRNWWFCAPNYQGVKALGGEATTFHDEAWSFAIWEGGSVITLTCTPTAKNGGRKGVNRLVKHRQGQRKLIALDRAC